MGKTTSATLVCKVGNVYTNINVHVHIHVHVQYTCTYTCTIYMYMYIVHVYVHVHIHVHIHVHVYCTCTCTCTYTCTYTCTCILYMYMYMYMYIVVYILHHRKTIMCTKCICNVLLVCVTIPCSFYHNFHCIKPTIHYTTCYKCLHRNITEFSLKDQTKTTSTWQHVVLCMVDFT